MSLSPIDSSVSTKAPEASKQIADSHEKSTITSTPKESLHDQAVISPEGHAALNQEKSQAPVTTPVNAQAAASALANTAAQLGRGLLHSNPERYKQIDPDMDGKLTVAEARSAGLMH